MEGGIRERKVRKSAKKCRKVQTSFSVAGHPRLYSNAGSVRQLLFWRKHARARLAAPARLVARRADSSRAARLVEPARLLRAAGGPVHRGVSRRHLVATAAAAAASTFATASRCLAGVATHDAERPAQSAPELVRRPAARLALRRRDRRRRLRQRQPGPARVQGLLQTTVEHSTYSARTLHVHRIHAAHILAGHTGGVPRVQVRAARSGERCAHTHRPRTALAPPLRRPPLLFMPTSIPPAAPPSAPPSASFQRRPLRSLCACLAPRAQRSFSIGPGRPCQRQRLRATPRR